MFGGIVKSLAQIKPRYMKELMMINYMVEAMGLAIKATIGFFLITVILIFTFAFIRELFGND